jgi:drug/metabolite transporter (DMT)-like permease
MITGGLISTLARWDVVALGAALTLLACVAAAVQMLIAKKKVLEVHSSVMVFYRVFIAAIALGLLALAMGKANFNVEAKYWAAALVGAFLGPCAGYALAFRSFAYWDLSRTSIVKTAQPLFVLPMAYIVFGKLPAGTELIGGLVILAGAFWLAIVNR